MSGGVFHRLCQIGMKGLLLTNQRVAQAVPDDPYCGSFRRAFCPETDGTRVIRRQAQHEWLACGKGLVASSATHDSGLSIL